MNVGLPGDRRTGTGKGRCQHRGAGPGHRWPGWAPSALVPGLIAALAALGVALGACGGPGQAVPVTSARHGAAAPARAVARTGASALGTRPTARAAVTTSTVPVGAANTRTSVGTGRAPRSTASSLPRATPAHGTTSSTVMGGGNPSTWPAAKPYPPSLAGAYSTNLKKALISLLNYMDWVFAHPNPVLVKNAVVPTANIYRYWVDIVEALVRRGWHEYPNPTEVNFLKVIQPPVKASGFLGGTVDVVIDARRDPYLNNANQTVGYQVGGGRYAASIILGRATTAQHFRIARWYVLHPGGGLEQWERELQR